MASEYLNPFWVVGCIPDEYFCDRENETKRLSSCIINRENVVLSAPRRVGKTELINHCLSNPSVRKEMVVISLDILHTTSLREFTREFGNAVYSSLASKSDRLRKLFANVARSLVGCFGFDPINGVPTFNLMIGDIDSPEYTLDEIFTFLNQAKERTLIVIDEFQQIRKYKDKNVEALLRGRIQKSANSTFIFAGSERRLMDRMFQDPTSPFYQSATSLWLDTIPKEVYVDFANRMFSKGELKISDEAVNFVYEQFQGITAYIQRIMHDAYSESTPGSTIDIAVVGALCDRFLQENSRNMKERLSSISESQKEVLYAIGDAGKVKSITSAAFLKKYRLKSASSVQSAVRYLKENELITESLGTYSITDSLMSLWLKQKLV